MKFDEASRFLRAYADSPEVAIEQRKSDEATFGKEVIDECQYRQGEGINAYTDRLCLLFPSTEQQAYIRGLSELLLAKEAAMQALSKYLFSDPVTTTIAAYFKPEQHQHLSGVQDNLSAARPTLQMTKEKAVGLIFACNTAIAHLRQFESRKVNKAKDAVRLRAKEDPFVRMKVSLSKMLFGQKKIDSQSEVFIEQAVTAQTLNMNTTETIAAFEETARSLHDPFDPFELSTKHAIHAQLALGDLSIYAGVIGEFDKAVVEAVKK